LAEGTREDSLAVIHGLYATIEHGDMAGALGFIDPDIVITYLASMPMGGVWRGHDGLKSLFAQVNTLWEGHVSTVDRFLADGDRVIVLLTVEGRINGHHIRMPFVESWRVRGGKLIEGRPYFWDTTEIERAVAAGR